MAAVEVTITGVLYDKTQRTARPVVLIGEASLTGLGVGGGPLPGGPGGPEVPGEPPGIWGPTDPRPTPPIHIPPTTLPDLPPLQIWGPNDPRPNPPIYLPEPKPPAGSLIDWKAVWSPSTGWIVVGVPNVPHPAPSKK